MNKLFFLCVGLVVLSGWTVAAARSSHLRLLANEPEDATSNSEANYDEMVVIRRKIRPRLLAKGEKKKEKKDDDEESKDKDKDKDKDSKLKKGDSEEKGKQKESDEKEKESKDPAPPPVAVPTTAPPPVSVPRATAPPPSVAVSQPLKTTLAQTICGTGEGPILLGSSGTGGLYRNDVLFFGGLLMGAIPTNVTELVVDLTTNRAWIQVGEGSFTLLEIDPYTGEEIEDTRFSTSSISQFPALEIIEGALYGAGGGVGSNKNSSLYRIDPDAGIWEEIGPTGLLRPLSGLAWNGTTLYATSGGGSSPSQLYTINIQTGAATIVCAALPQAFESLVYYPQTGVIYGGTPDGIISQIDPINCLTRNSKLNYSNWWNAGYSPITGLTMVCPQVL